MGKKSNNFLKRICLIFMYCIGILVMMSLSSSTTYAYTDPDLPQLRSLYVSEGNDLDFERNQYKYILDVKDDVKEMYIKPKPYDSDDVVTVNGKEVTSDDKYKYKYTMKLEQGKNTFKIQVKSKKGDTSLYTLYIYRGGENAVYLKDLTFDDGNIGFRKTQRNYNIELDEGTKSIKLKAYTYDDRYTVSINGTNLDERNTIKLKFKESLGKYTLNVKVKDEDTGRIGEYSFDIYIGIPVTPNVEGAINSILKPNQWLIVNGRWRYNDKNGECLEDTWFYDPNYKGYYYLNSRGNMETGWFTDGGNTYYLGIDGKMQTGWLKYDNLWYYLDENGVKRVGWIASNGTWYYLNNNGVMQTGWTKVNDKWYFFNKDGAMDTGWILYNKNWYYLDYDDGDMITGWLYYNNEWYYLNDDGSMKSGEWVYYKDDWYYINYAGNMRCGWLYKDDKYYYLNDDGTMQNESKVIDGYVYYFNADGSVDFGSDS